MSKNCVEQIIMSKNCSSIWIEIASELRKQEKLGLNSDFSYTVNDKKQMDGIYKISEERYKLSDFFPYKLEFKYKAIGQHSP